MSRPDFVLVGVPKAGTTSLHRYLSAHPQINVTNRAEINFLSFPGAAAAAEHHPTMTFAVRTDDDYRALWAAEPGTVGIDFSASCFRSAVAIDRIRQFAADATLILLLRDPAERAFSAYLQRRRKGYERRSPEQALVAGEPPVDMGLYAGRVAEFQHTFGPDRVLVWLTDDLRDDPDGTLRSMLRAFGVDDRVDLVTSGVDNAGYGVRAPLTRLGPALRAGRRLAAALPAPLAHAARTGWRAVQPGAPPVPPTVDRRLRALYADDIVRLESLIGRDLSAWRSPRARDLSPTAG